jgi:hypothetical protein
MARILIAFLFSNPPKNERRNSRKIERLKKAIKERRIKNGRRKGGCLRLRLYCNALSTTEVM